MTTTEAINAAGKMRSELFEKYEGMNVHAPETFEALYAAAVQIFCAALKKEPP